MVYTNNDVFDKNKSTIKLNLDKNLKGDIIILVKK